VRILEAAILEARQVIIAQRADVVAWAGFAESVRALIGAFESNNEVPIDLHADGTGPTTEVALQADVLRIIHEACSNAVRHGAAGRIDVRLAADADRLDLWVRDDGTGFDPARAQGESGLGLQSMRERTARWGGTCSIESSPGQGTVVHTRFSLSPRREPGT
jgi:signal transduction histidine kinase